MLMLPSSWCTRLVRHSTTDNGMRHLVALLDPPLAPLALPLAGQCTSTAADGLGGATGCSLLGGLAGHAHGTLLGQGL